MNAKLDQHNGFLAQVSCYRSTKCRKWNCNIRAASSSDPREALPENARKYSTQRECYKSVSQAEAEDCKVRNFAK